MVAVSPSGRPSCIMGSAPCFDEWSWDNQAMVQLRIGVDTGGTFTDILLQSGDESALVTHKLPSTPADPAHAVLAGIKAVLDKYANETCSPPFVVHGSTVATNALLEGKGARTAFITTAGFEDTLYIGRQNRPDIYALQVEKPQPPVERQCCLGVKERNAFDGSVLRKLSNDDIQGLLAQIKALDVESIVLSLLHGYANPSHEQAIAEVIRRSLPGLHLTVATELLPEFREYERASTCLINAVVAPAMTNYIKRLVTAVGSDNLRIMSSAGGSLPVDVITHFPVNTILSGPAGGVIGAHSFAQAIGETRIITFDMGGTSTDVALCDGGLSRTTESTIAGMPIRLPMIDIHTVGAGGGSIAWVDDGGALHIGPQSVGANPGPACYGKQQGTPQATVTDAHVVLNHIPADTKLAGNLVVNHQAACDSMEPIMAATNLGLAEVAQGILRIAEATMARAIQRISVERGYDPRNFTLVSFGGAGGLHATSLADLLGIERVLIPPNPGLLSALGMLTSVPLHCFSSAVMQRVRCVNGGYRDPVGIPAVADALAELGKRARTSMDSERITPASLVLKPAIDLRYSGQSFELTIPLDEGNTVTLFKEQHARLYGYNPAGKDLEVVAVRMQATALAEQLHLPMLARREHGSVMDVCQSHSGESAIGVSEYKYFSREDLLAADHIPGPAIIAEYSSTTLVARGWHCDVSVSGHLVLERNTAEGAS